MKSPGPIYESDGALVIKSMTKRSRMELCLFSSTPDMATLNFVVKVLTGTLEELAQRAIEWGYDGIEFMPDPENSPDPGRWRPG